MQFFARDTTGFDAFDISALAGSITDVDDYDWSLPGGVTEEGDVLRRRHPDLAHRRADDPARLIAARPVNADPGGAA